MNPENFSVNDLLKKRDFRKWVKHPSPELDSFWKSWRGTDPKRAQLMDQAKLVLLSIDFKKTGPQDIDDQCILSRIKHTILQDQLQSDKDNPDKNQVTDTTEGKQSDGDRLSSTHFYFSRWQKMGAALISLLLFIGKMIFVETGRAEAYSVT